MNTKLDTKRLLIFIAFAYGIAWITALVIFLTGGIQNSPMLIPAANIRLSLILMAIPYMFAPSLANILTRLITREGWKDTGLRPNFKKGWKFWLIAWIGTPVLILSGMAIFFALFPQYYDANLVTFGEMLKARGMTELPPLWPMLLGSLFQGILISPIVNLLPILGEEFGWRAYLLPKLLPLGPRKASIWVGIIWGLWHAPVIAMGHNYGLEYPGFPWAGILVMTWAVTLVGIFEAWVTLRAGSVWPAVITHALLNGISGIAVMIIIGTPNPIIGPISLSLVGSLGFLIVSALLIALPKFWPQPAAEQ